MSAGLSLEEEGEQALRIHGEAADRRLVPRRETEALVARLAGRLDDSPVHATARPIDAFGDLTTTHMLNVALLAMGLARHLAFDEAERLALGVAGLLHDVGRVRIGDREKPPTDPVSEVQHTLMREHPTIGARLLLDSGGAFSLAAVVAYEHHLGWEGTGGYPTLTFPRSPHLFSRIVSICDAYDVLRTERPFRAGLSVEAAIGYLQVLAGKTLDPEIVTGFMGFASTPHAWIGHPATLPEGTLTDIRRLPDSSFDPDFEPGPTPI